MTAKRKESRKRELDKKPRSDCGMAQEVDCSMQLGSRHNLGILTWYAPRDAPDLVAAVLQN